MPQPDWIAEMDQAVASVKDFAMVTAAYYRALIAEGVPDHDATAIVMAWQRVMIEQHDG